MKIEIDKTTQNFYKSITLGRIANIAYEKYRLQWFADRNYDIRDIFGFAIEAAKEQIKNCAEAWRDNDMSLDELEDMLDNINMKNVLEQFEETGIYFGECYVCFEEFLKNEFKDRELMKRLLDENDFKTYCIASEGIEWE